MEKLLFVNCCISERGESSRTNSICNAFLDGYRETHPNDAIEIEDLRTAMLVPLNNNGIQERDSLIAMQKWNSPLFQFATRFKDADKVLIGAPYWDLSYPAQMELYIEYISTEGYCYHTDRTGTHGDCNAAKLAYLTVGGEPEKPNSLGVEHWLQLSELFGIPEYEYLYAGGLETYPDQTESLVAAAEAKAHRMGAEF